MVAYSFKKRFAAPILDHSKTGTIRAPRKRHARPGEELQLYTGMRTKSCRLVARETCMAVHDVAIDVGLLTIHSIAVDGVPIADLDAFARGDGFTDLAEMHGFWKAEQSPGLFEGVWIRWASPPPVAGLLR